MPFVKFAKITTRYGNNANSNNKKRKNWLISSNISTFDLDYNTTTCCSALCSGRAALRMRSSQQSCPVSAPAVNIAG